MPQTVNNVTPFGLRPIRHLNGNPWNGATRKYMVEASYGTALYLGDAVELTGDVGVSDTRGFYPSIEKSQCATTKPVLGVITSFDKVMGSVVHDEVYRVASTFRYANVCVDPDVVFIIRDDGDALLTGDECTENANIISTESGSTATGLSGMELDASADPPEPLAVDQLLILGVWPEENNVLAIHCIWEVIISHHFYRCQTGILGI